MKTRHQIKKEHFANLLAVAYADKQIKQEELDFLAQKAVDYGLDEAEVKEMIGNIQNLHFYIPLNQEDREQQLTDVIYLTMIDGEIADAEYELCLKLAEKLELSKDYLDHLIQLVKELWSNENQQT